MTVLSSLPNIEKMLKLQEGEKRASPAGYVRREDSQLASQHGTVCDPNRGSQRDVAYQVKSYPYPKPCDPNRGSRRDVAYLQLGV